MGRYSRGKSPEIVEDGLHDVGRSMSPIINPYERRSLSPIIDLTDVEMVSPPQPSGVENIPPIKTSITAGGKQPANPMPRATPSIPLFSSRPALGLRSGNIPLSSLLDPSINEIAALPAASGAIVQMEDPHFVLGISKGAREAEYVHFPVTRDRS